MTKPLVIGLSGKKGSGKDTTYKILFLLGMKGSSGSITLDRVAFADALKEEVAAAFGVSVKFIEDNKEKFRTLLQGWGESRRWCFGMDYWIGKTAKKVGRTQADVIVVTDVRYENEAEWVKSLGGVLVRVKRPESTQDGDTHKSETDLDDYEFDCSIFNSMSRDFEGVVERLWESAILPKLNGSSRTNR